MSKSSSSQSTASSTVATDNRKAVGDAGVLAETGSVVDQSVVDARDLSDHSSFSIQTTDARDLSNRSTNVDSRDLSDHSSFSSSVTDARQTNSTDARDFSDRSSFSSSSSTSDNSTHNTTVNAADAEVLKATASGAFTAANLVTSQSTQLLDSALRFGDQVSARAIQAQIGAVDQLAETTRGAVQLAQQAAGIVADNAKTADQGVSEKLIKGGVIVAVVIAVLFFFFRPSRK